MQIERALAKGEARLRDHLHPDPYIGAFPAAAALAGSHLLTAAAAASVDEVQEPNAPCLAAPLSFPIVCPPPCSALSPGRQPVRAQPAL